jgi:hypothetical protein
MKKTLLKLTPVQRGMPCKCYVNILDLDRELNMFLSYVSRTPFFDSYIASLIQRYHRSNDRKLATENFLKFSVTFTEDRISYIYPSKIFSRIHCIQLLNLLYDGVVKYSTIKKNLKDESYIPTKEEQIFYTLFKRRWLVNDKFFIKQVKTTHANVKRILDALFKSYERFIIKFLLKNRRGANTPKDFISSSYEVLMNVINVYNPHRSKVPLYKLIRPYACNYKNVLIKQDTWGLESTQLVRLDALSETNIVYESGVTKEKVDEKDMEPTILLDEVDSVTPQETPEIDDETYDDTIYNDTDEAKSVISIKNNVWKNIESSLHFEKKQDDKLRLLEMAFQSLPRPFKELTSIHFELVDPLEIEQELGLALNLKV